MNKFLLSFMMGTAVVSSLWAGGPLSYEESMYGGEEQEFPGFLGENKEETKKRENFSRPRGSQRRPQKNQAKKAPFSFEEKEDQHGFPPRPVHNSREPLDKGQMVEGLKTIKESMESARIHFKRIFALGTVYELLFSSQLIKGRCALWNIGQGLYHETIGRAGGERIGKRLKRRGLPSFFQKAGILTNKLKWHMPLVVMSSWEAWKINSSYFQAKRKLQEFKSLSQDGFEVKKLQNIEDLVTQTLKTYWLRHASSFLIGTLCNGIMDTILHWVGRKTGLSYGKGFWVLGGLLTASIQRTLTYFIYYKPLVAHMIQAEKKAEHMIQKTVVL